jgi:hypothetical protein
VEKASGEQVTLREYLEYVWAAVAKEALAMVFSGADATAFEEDARLTAIWFWALKANGAEAEGESLEVSEEDPDEDAAEEVTGTSRKQKLTGYALPYDTARKLAQGLGADLGKLNRPGGIVTIKGNVATLNGIMGRENGLVGQQLALFRTEAPALSRRTRGQPRDPTAVMQPVQGRLEALFDQQPPTIHDPLKPVLPHLQVDSEPRSLMERLLNSGTTRLDRLHQAMLLFGRSQTSLIGPLLMETGVGQDQRFWQLAQALSALYPPSSDEKRWVDGVLARKKGLGF